MRQQRYEHRPGFRGPRVSWQGGFDHRRGGLLPRCGQPGRHLSNRDGLDQPVHRHRPIAHGAHQRVAAQRGDRISDYQLVLQQRHQVRRHLSAKPVLDPGAGLQQQRQRDGLGCAVGQQPQQATRARRGLPQVLERQSPGSGYGLAVPGRLAALQHLGAPPPEQCQVTGQAVAASLDVGSGLLQRQRQPAQFTSQAQGSLLVRIAGTGDQEIRSGLGVKQRHVQSLAGRPQRALASDQHPATAGLRQEWPHRFLVRSMIEHQQPLGRVGSQHGMHRRHRIPPITLFPYAELGGQLGEFGPEHRRVLRRELPGHPHLGQVQVRIFHRHAGLPRAPQPVQHRNPRAGIIASGQAGTQLGEQFLPVRQERRPRFQPQHRVRRPVSVRPIAQHAVDPGAQLLD